MSRQHEHFTNLRVFEHPLIQRKLTRMRDRNTSSDVFRSLMNQIAGLMTFEITREFPTAQVEIESPLERTTGVKLSRPVTLVPILRAGIGMTDGIQSLMPEARVGHIGVYRDEQSLKPVPYYAKLPPDVSKGPVLVIDPMLATGGSASFVVKHIKDAGCDDVALICLVAAPEGVRIMLDDHPDVVVYTAALDRQLDERGYILPGLGDAGDRLFGTH